MEGDVGRYCTLRKNSGSLKNIMALKQLSTGVRILLFCYTSPEAARRYDSGSSRLTEISGIDQEILNAPFRRIRYT
jgi:hypothetical protein